MTRTLRLTAGTIIAALICAVTLAGSTMNAGAAPSGPPPPGPNSTVQERVNAALRANPGSLPPQAPGDRGDCSLYYLCLYEDADFGSPHGYHLAFYNCGFVDIGHIKFPEGGTPAPGQPGWNDKVSSIINHQSHGTRSLF